METNFWNSPLTGVVIGSVIAGTFTWLAQVFADRRQKKLFAHDLEIRKQQFAHEKEQEIRGRRTAALADLQMQLGEQATAVQNLWGFACHHPDLHYPKSSAEEAWDVLFRKSYGRNVWPVENSVARSLGGYSRKIRELLMFLGQQEEFDALWRGEISALDKGLHEVINEKFLEVKDFLDTVTMDVTELTARLNGIDWGDSGEGA